MAEHYVSCRNFDTCQGVVRLVVPDRDESFPDPELPPAAILGQTCICQLTPDTDGMWLVEYRLPYLN